MDILLILAVIVAIVVLLLLALSWSDIQRYLRMRRM